MRSTTGKSFRQKISIPAMTAFLSSVVLCSAILIMMVTDKANLDKLMMEQVIIEKTVKLTEIVHRLLYKTEALSALVIQNNGEVSNFERVASTMLDDPAIINVLIAPAGTVTHVYPLRGNEAVVGLDFFEQGAGNREARMARQTGRLTFGGPFELVQGGRALVGRLPVYMETPGGSKMFWGLVSVTLRYPEVLDGLGLASLEKQGYAFEIWRVNPDTYERQIIAHSDYEYNKNARFIEKKMEILNAVWYFRLSPVRHWYQYTETWVLFFFSMLVSGLIAFVVQNNHELKHMQILLEDMAQNDSLTGIANRRHFMDMAPLLLQQAIRDRQSCFLIMVDVDHFKKVNDSYGHAAGDMVLSAITWRIKQNIRPYDLFARYGGEEFIILAMGLEQEAAENLCARTRLNICESPFVFNNTAIPVTASFGLARVSPDTSLDETIRQADAALYMAKKTGRNRTVVYDAEMTLTD